MKRFAADGIGLRNCICDRHKTVAVVLFLKVAELLLVIVVLPTCNGHFG
jgi:hypothetical protein